MPTSMITQNISISLVATPDTSAAVLYGLHEVFSVVSATEDYFDEPQTNRRLITPRIVSKTTEPMRTVLGASIVADHTFDEAHISDIIIIGDLNVTPEANPEGKWDVEMDWVRDQYRNGAIICSVCTGSIMLAEAGLLNNLEATCHWSARNIFKTRYPLVLFRPERILASAGMEHRIITSGGSASWIDLAVYLIARFCGNGAARNIAKLFLFGDRSDGQLPFAAMVRPAQHEDAVVARCQEWIADHYDINNPVEKMTEKAELPPRTFKRRFLKATGYAPLEYVQTLRIEEAKQMLETTDDAIDNIASLVGYTEPNSFRRLFKRTTGISPHQYRIRFKSVTII